MEPYIIGFGASVVGGLTALVAVLIGEIWRAVLDFQVAVRVVRGELLRNQAMLRITCDDPVNGPTNFVDDAWTDQRNHLAFLLDEREWRMIALHYTLVGNLQHDLRKGTRVSLEFIEELLSDMDKPIEILTAIVKRMRTALLLDALRGRLTSPALLGM